MVGTLRHPASHRYEVLIGMVASIAIDLLQVMRLGHQSPHLRRSFMRRRAIVAIALAIVLLPVATPASAAPSAAEPAQYEILDVRTLAARNAIARTGAAIDGVEHSVVTVTATGPEVRQL